MSYMWPSYVPVDAVAAQLSRHYELYLYREGHAAHAAPLSRLTGEPFRP